MCCCTTANSIPLLPIIRLINLAVPPPGIKFKQSAMPFVQMENISHFLRACQMPPLNLQQHDVFLTVDLYEQKDPAQVLQCLGAFSRAANAVNPSNFPTPIGPQSRAAGLSPQHTGPASTSPIRGRGMSTTSNTSSMYGSARPVLTASKTGDSGSGRWSPTKSPTKSPTNGSTSPGVSVSSWSKREHEGATAPAWNIAQYGYMGGASQGNLGIAFGGRRQITSAGPYVPNSLDKERRRREREAEEERQRHQMEEEELRRKAELEAEEERARLEEARRWEEETKRLREEERRKAADEKKRWAEEERMWKLTEEKRRQEEDAADARLADERRRTRSRSDAKLRGQYLSQYQAEQAIKPQGTGGDGEYSSRIKELEKELELAREREREYERERQERKGRPSPAPVETKTRARSKSRTRPVSRQDSWSRDEREYLRTQYQQQQGAPQFQQQQQQPQQQPQQALPPKQPNITSPPQQRSSRPLPDPTAVANTPPPMVKSHNTGGSRPLPDPTAYKASPSPAPQQNANRTDRFLAHNKAPVQPPTQPTYSRELGATSERDGEDRRRAQSQTKTKAGGWASKSLLEREMEMERQRQREWEDSQKETARTVRSGDGVDGIGGGIDGRWDVNQWTGYTGGDSQNKGGQGIGAGRRQIVGPRPLPGSNR
jgi:transgelin